MKGLFTKVNRVWGEATRDWTVSQGEQLQAKERIQQLVTAVVLKFRMHQDFLENLLKHRLLGLTPKLLFQQVWGRIRVTIFFTHSLVMTMLLGLGKTVEKAVLT